jgi:hypothetical protein
LSKASLKKILITSKRSFFEVLAENFNPLRFLQSFKDFSSGSSDRVRKRRGLSIVS